MRAGFMHQRQRGMIVSLILAVLLGAAVFLIGLALDGTAVLGTLAVIAVVAEVALVHYLVWGTREGRRLWRDQDGTRPTENGYDKQHSPRVPASA